MLLGCKDEFCLLIVSSRLPSILVSRCCVCLYGLAGASVGFRAGGGRRWGYPGGTVGISMVAFPRHSQHEKVRLTSHCCGTSFS